MNLTGKQLHVLANIERVSSLPYQLKTPSPRSRYQLDGWDCTPQITSLVVKKRIERSPTGALVPL